MVYFSHLALAQDSNGLAQGQIGLNPENIPKPDNINQIKSDYLKKEWGKILANNTYFGPIIKAYNKISPITNPIFRYTTGIEPGLNWTFILGLFLLITFLIYIYRILSVFSTFSSGASFIISLALVVILGNIGFIKIVSSSIVKLFSALTSWWAQLIFVVLFWALLIVASMYSKQVAALLKKWKEARKKAIEEEKISNLKAEQNIEKKFRKDITNALGDESEDE